MSRDALVYVEDIASACHAIARFTNGVTLDAFEANEEKRSAVERQVLIIGEAASRLPEDLRSRCPEVPWRQIVGLRNILAHGYWRIEPSELLNVAQAKVPDLLAAVEQLLPRPPTGR